VAQQHADALDTDKTYTAQSYLIVTLALVALALIVAGGVVACRVRRVYTEKERERLQGIMFGEAHRTVVGMVGDQVDIIF
jgi:hypothetical protein